MNERVLVPSAIARREGFPYMYHLLHMANLRSVMNFGLLSRREVDARGIAVSSLQSRPVRAARSLPVALPDGSSKPLDQFLSFRWFPSTPILAHLAYDWTTGQYSEERQEFLVLLEVDVIALDSAKEVWFALESPLTRECALLGREQAELIPWERLRTVRERHGDFSDPVCGSEILVDDVVGPEFLRAAVVCNKKAASRLEALGVTLPVKAKPEWFFGCEGE